MKVLGKVVWVFIIFETIICLIYKNFNSLIAYVVMLLVFIYPVYYVFKSYKDTCKEEDKNIPMKQVLRLLPVTILLFVCYNIAETGVVSFFITKMEQDYIKNYSFVLAAVVYAPIIEELILRGILLNILERKYSFWLSNLVQASIFCILHFDLQLSVVYLLFGLIMGILKKRTNIYSCILVHALNNGLACYMMFFPVKVPLSRNLMLIIGLLFTVITLLIIKHLYNRTDGNNANSIEQNRIVESN